MLVFLVALVAVALLAACGGDADGDGVRHATPETPTPTTPTPTPIGATPTPPPTEFRVAFINLHSPLLQDLGDDAVEETFNQRLQMILVELRSFDPDVVGINEAFRSTKFPDVLTTIGRELGMVPCFQRANPWLPGQTRDQSNALADQVGFEEGELILVRNTYQAVRPCERYVLQPLTTESGEGRIGVHWVIKGPRSFGGDGEIDIFITHLKGGTDAVRAQQALDFARWVAEKRGSGPSIVMAGQDDATSASNYDAYRAIGLRDVLTGEDVVTCCRVSVVGEQQPLTARNDYLMYDRMQVISAEFLGERPEPMPDGSLVYASDHLGIKAVFAVPPERSGIIP